jgi:hypothetical protein
MPPDLAPEDQAGLKRIVNQLEAAWNGMDGSAFAAPFAGDADFVTIRCAHFRGRSAIAAGHAAIFRTIYAGPSASRSRALACCARTSRSCTCVRRRTQRLFLDGANEGTRQLGDRRIPQHIGGGTGAATVRSSPAGAVV